MNEMRSGGSQGAATLLTMRPRTSYEILQDAADTDIPYLTGKIRTFWGPKGKRVAIEVSEEMHDQHEEYGHVGRPSTYVRSIGPQIKILDAGIGHQDSRKAAALFDKEGLTITVVQPSKKSSTGVQLYYRGDAGKQAAQKVAKLFDDPQVEEMKKAGWVDLIVVLGGSGNAGGSGATSSGTSGGN